jgi:hypothetical protein
MDKSKNTVMPSEKMLSYHRLHKYFKVIICFSARTLETFWFELLDEYVHV